MGFSLASLNSEFTWTFLVCYLSCYSFFFSRSTSWLFSSSSPYMFVVASVGGKVFHHFKLKKNTIKKYFWLISSTHITEFWLEITSLLIWPDITDLVNNRAMVKGFLAWLPELICLWKDVMHSNAYSCMYNHVLMHRSVFEQGYNQVEIIYMLELLHCMDMYTCSKYIYMYGIQGLYGYRYIYISYSVSLIWAIAGHELCPNQINFSTSKATQEWYPPIQAQNCLTIAVLSGYIFERACAKARNRIDCSNCQVVQALLGPIVKPNYKLERVHQLMGNIKPYG